MPPSPTPRRAPRWRRSSRARAQALVEGARAAEREDIGGRVELVRRAVGFPVEDEVRRGGIDLGDGPLPAAARQRCCGDEDAGNACGGSALERHALDLAEALVRLRRLELPERAHLRGRSVQARLAPGRLLQLLGSG